MPRIRTGADEIVEGQVQRLLQPGESGGHPVHIGRGRDSGLGRAAHVLQRVVIGTGLASDLVTALPAMSGQHVRLDEFERVADMRPTVDIGNGGRHEITSHVLSYPLGPDPLPIVEAVDRASSWRFRTRRGGRMTP